MSMPDRGTVFVVDDDPSVRSALKRLVASVGLDCETFASADDYLNGQRPVSAACLVLDVRMPGASGLDLQDQLSREGYCPPIIFLTAHGDVRTSVRAMKAGAAEFLTKPFHEQELLEAIQHAIERDRDARRRHEERARRRKQHDSLSARERQVLTLVVAGLLNKQIAAELNLSESTVKLHRAEVMQKMEAHSLAELVSIASELDIVARSSSLDMA
jgi:RNA polymerase sigma factor (sigma-70 family)